MLTLKGHNEDKVRFSAEHLRKQLEAELKDWKDLIIAGPAPARRGATRAPARKQRTQKS